ncbi:MAG: hypothetical protein Q8M22_19160 [Actinomycetota bacterium]|nr:hypothetical protein [Actinomycetota bacterium]
MPDLVLLQLPRTARASLVTAFAGVGVTVHLPQFGRRATELPAGAPVATVLRHPIDRLQSHFHLRVRAGRPHHPEMWTDWEAAFFTAIHTFDAWGEAIISTNEFLRSAADRGLLLWHSHERTLLELLDQPAHRDAFVAGSVDDLPAAVERLAALVQCDVPELSTDPAVIDATPPTLPRERSELAEMGFRIRLADEIERYETLLERVPR